MKNILYNYYAISRFEMEKYQDDQEGVLYKLNYYAENLIKGLLNNCFSFVLNKDAIMMLEALKEVDNTDLDNANIVINTLKDSIVLYDAKYLRKEDSIEYLFKALTLYLRHYANYQKNPDEEILKHRYDIIFDEIKKSEYVGSLLLKMGATVINSLSNIILNIKKTYKDNVLCDALIQIRNIYYNAILCLLFKDTKALNMRIDYLVLYFVTLNELFSTNLNNEDLIRKLNLYSDYYFSYHHHIKLPSGDENIDKFSELYGFLDNNDIQLLIEKHYVLDENFYEFSHLNSLFKSFLSSLKERFNDIIGEDIAKINVALDDIVTLLDNIKE